MLTRPGTQKGTLAEPAGVSAFGAVRASESGDWRVRLLACNCVSALEVSPLIPVFRVQETDLRELVLTFANTLTWGLRLPPARLIAPRDAAASAPRPGEPAPARTGILAHRLWCVPAVTALCVASVSLSAEAVHCAGAARNPSTCLLFGV